MFFLRSSSYVRFIYECIVSSNIKLFFPFTGDTDCRNTYDIHSLPCPCKNDFVYGAHVTHDQFFDSTDSDHNEQHLIGRRPMVFSSSLLFKLCCSTWSKILYPRQALFKQYWLPVLRSLFNDVYGLGFKVVSVF